MRLKLPFAVAAIFVLAGMLVDSSYQRSTPEPVYVQGTVVGFDPQHARQVYPIFEFTDANGRVHRVLNSSQQAFVRFAAGDVWDVRMDASAPGIREDDPSTPTSVSS